MYLLMSLALKIFERSRQINIISHTTIKTELLLLLLH